MMKDLTRRTTLGLLSAGFAAPVQALAPGTPAPDWDVAQWFNTDPFSLASLRGQVVVIEFFQLWCPGCNSFSIPLMKQWEQEFAADLAADRMKIVSIHTVFEGHDHQTPRRLETFIRKKGITHPVGHDRHDIDDRLPNTMILYGTRGTPETAIIAPDGLIAFQQFGRFDTARAAGLIRDLLRG